MGILKTIANGCFSIGSRIFALFGAKEETHRFTESWTLPEELWFTLSEEQKIKARKANYEVDVCITGAMVVLVVLFILLEIFILR